VSRAFSQLPAVIRDKLSIIVPMRFVAVGRSFRRVCKRNVIAANNPNLLTFRSTAITLAGKEQCHLVIGGAQGANMTKFAFSVGFQKDLVNL
jgi:hypothetical protein